MPKITVGLVGASSSGMWILTDELEKIGFETFSLSEEVRKRSGGCIPDRGSWAQVGSRLRDTHGSNFFARVTAPLIWSASPQYAIADSIRVPSEAEFFRNWFGAKIIGLNAAPEVRYQMMLDRKRGVDPLDEEAFYELDRQDRGIGIIKYGQVDNALAVADLVLDHEGDLKNLRSRVRSEIIPYLSLTPSKER